jgi:hypothetical protein
VSGRTMITNDFALINATTENGYDYAIVAISN